MLSRKSLAKLLSQSNEITPKEEIVNEEESTPKEEFQSIINLMNKDIKKKETKKRKKLVVSKLKDFMEFMFPPHQLNDDFFN